MKKILAMMLAITMMVSMMACGNNAEKPLGVTAEEVEQNPSKAEIDYESLEGILVGTENDFIATAAYLNEKLAAVKEKVGDNYDAYKANKQMIWDWNQLVLTESEALFEREARNSEAFFRLLVDTVDHEDDKALDDALDQIYDRIYEDAYEDFYEAVYEDAFDESYDYYYDGILGNSDAAPNYDEWYDEREEFWDNCYDSREDLWDAWYDARENLWDVHYDVGEKFWKGDFELDDVFRDSLDDASSESAAVDKVVANDDSERNTGKDGVKDEELDQYFVDMMDEYEAFFDEYVDFMIVYKEREDTSALLEEYNDYMTQYVEIMDSMQNVDQDTLSKEEAFYYLEVTTRISQKLLSVM